jgi:hypothetical protein
MSAQSGKPVLTGEVVSYTDVLNSGGVVQYGPYGTSDKSLVRVVRFPQNQDAFSKEMASFLFRVVNPTPDIVM